MNTKRIWTIVGLFTLAYWGGSTDPQYPIILVEFLSGRFGVGPGPASLPIVTFTVGAAIGTLGCGLLVQRLGIGTLIFVCLWLFTGCSYLNTLEGPLWLFDVTRFLTGIWQGGLALLFLLGIGVLVPESRRGFALGVLSAGAMMAVAVVPALVFVTRPPGDHWQTPFLGFGAATLLAALGLHAVRLPLNPRTDAVEVSPWPLLRDPQMLALLALGGVLLVSIVAMSAQFFVFAKDQFGKELHQLLPEMITIGVGAVSGAVIAGKLTDRIGPRPILVWSSVIVTVFFGLVPLLAQRAWAVYPVFFIMSGLAAARVPPYQTLMLNVIPENARGSILSIRNLGSYVGTGLGAGGGGFLYQLAESKHLSNMACYQAVAIYAALFSVVALWIAIRFVPRHRTGEFID
jgi:predicted MFS family arabinose efflux permease